MPDLEKRTLEEFKGTEEVIEGTVTIGMFMEPIGTEDIRITGSDHWVVGMRPDDPLLEKEYIGKKGLLGKPLILPERVGVQSEIANWFGKDFNKIQKQRGNER